MKKTLLSAVTIGVVVLTSCDSKPPVPPEATFPVGTWLTTHQYFDLTVDSSPPEYTNRLKEMLEQETSVDVTEAESYKLRFNWDGTGSGSGVRHDGNGRYDFNFTWELSDDMPPWWPSRQSSNGSFLLIKWSATSESGYGGVFFEYNGTARENVTWKVEEYFGEEMVLEYIQEVFADGTVDGVDMPWSETHTYRYTFERVK